MDWTTPGLGLRIGGHRGAAGEAPENTFAGFARAVAAGVDYLELDVQLTVDGAALVFHDEDLDRTTDGSGPFATHTKAAILDVDAGAWFDPAFAGERIPTLDAFLAWLAGQSGPGATIEAKSPGTGETIARALLASPARGGCSICSFSADELRAAASVDPSIPRILIVDRDDRVTGPIDAAGRGSATAVNVPFDWLTVEEVRRLHGAGLFVAGGTVDDATWIASCLELGIDAVDTNRPTVTVPARNALRDRITGSRRT
jgi:glycerophosphoryl diester phosphodiesterase